MTRLRFRSLGGLAVGAAVCLCASGSWAQSDDDLLDDLGAPEPEPAAVEEIEADTLSETTIEPKPKPKPKKAQTPAAQDRIKAVPRKAVLKKGRFELAAFATVSLNDAFWQHVALSGSAVYYPHDAFGLGLGIDYLFAHAATSNLDVMRETMISVEPEHEKPRLFVHLDLYWIPIYGKISLFDRVIVHFDMYATAGVGFATYFGKRQLPEVNAGLGQRFFLSDWLALRIEVRDHLYVDNLTVAGQTRSDIQNYVMFMAGVSFYLPPTFEYSYR